MGNEVMKEMEELLANRDAQIDEVNRLLNEIVTASQKARESEAAYIQKCAKELYGIEVSQCGDDLTHVRFKKSNEIGVLRIVPNRYLKVSESYYRAGGEPQTQISEKLRYFRLAFYPLKKNGLPSVMESRTSVMTYTRSLGQFMELFEVVS